MFRRTLLRVLSFGLGLGGFYRRRTAKKGEQRGRLGETETGRKRGLVDWTVQGGENLGLEGGTKPCDGARFRRSGFCRF